MVELTTTFATTMMSIMTTSSLSLSLDSLVLWTGELAYLSTHPLTIQLLNIPRNTPYLYLMTYFSTHLLNVIHLLTHPPTSSNLPSLHTHPPTPTNSPPHLNDSGRYFRCHSGSRRLPHNTWMNKSTHAWMNECMHAWTNWMKRVLERMHDNER